MDQNLIWHYSAPAIHKNCSTMVLGHPDNINIFNMKWKVNGWMDFKLLHKICKLDPPDNCCKDHHGSTSPSSQWKYLFLVANLVRGRLLGCRSCNSTPTFSLPHQHLTFLNPKNICQNFPTSNI